jgi:hypothetical protein
MTKRNADLRATASCLAREHIAPSYIHFIGEYDHE